MKMNMKRRLITSALPYVNNIPHLGNLIQVLSADVFARFCRLRGYETLYICGTDEYGTATETRALEEGITPKELCDKFYAIHSEIYEWFNISFDRFGRTSTRKQTEITQHLFLTLDAAGYINEQTIDQLYCDSCSRFLADRYIRGTCPHCGYTEARGDQCEDCGKLLDPTELKESRCGVCGKEPQLRRTDHLYIDLPRILPKLEEWLSEASERGFWARNAVQMTKSWIRDGLRERCITRDLKWGIPVPKDGYRDKVFYVWFDAPIGYISITANHTDEWESWWRNPAHVELFQFIGKDNIPFHTVIFPSTLIGSGEEWTLLHHMSSTEYLNYESGKFSKSKGIGVFGTDARETGIPVDVWRFYIFYNRPEKSDALFTWSDFQEKVNGELIGNLANFVNRTLSFLTRFYGGKLPKPTGSHNGTFRNSVDEMVSRVSEHLERAELRDAFRVIFSLSSLGNKVFQDGEPWRTVKEDPEQAGALLYDLTILVRHLGIMIRPYLPDTSGRIMAMLGSGEGMWTELKTWTAEFSVSDVEILFSKLEDDRITELREKFSGSQAERESVVPTSIPEKIFSEKVELCVARIVEVARHPNADKLYIERVSLGDEERQIVSGLVPYYSEADLTGRNIILVKNLKPARLRGEESRGMLLAATDNSNDSNEEEQLEVIFLDDARPGDLISVSEYEDLKPESPSEISIDEFFEVPIKVRNKTLFVGNRPLVCSGRKVMVNRVIEGEVG